MNINSCIKCGCDFDGGRRNNLCCPSCTLIGLQEQQLAAVVNLPGDSDAFEITTVKYAIDNLSTRLSDLIDVMEDISEKLNSKINKTSKPLPLPPLAFYDSLREWMAINKEPYHVALIGTTLQATFEICANLHNAFPEAKMASSLDKYKAGDLAGLLTCLSDGDVLIIRPESFPQGPLFDACTNSGMDICLDQGGSRSIHLDLPKFRLICVTKREKYLPPHTCIVWPQDDGEVSLP